MGLFANGVFVALFAIFLVASIVFASYFLFAYDEKRKKSIPFIALIVLFSLALGYSSTHRVVPVNQRWVIINTIKAEVEGGIRDSGLTTKPAVAYDILRFPGAKEQPFCIKYTPALKEGYEIFTDICGNYDASSLNWQQVYERFNIRSEEELLVYWANQSKEVVSQAFQSVDYTKLTTERPLVSTDIRNNLSPWFEDFGVTVTNLKLTNWDFTSEQVKQQVDKASQASMQKTVENQLLEAAKIARERQLYEVETANLILAQRGLGLQELIDSLDISDDNAKAMIASQMTWYAYAQNAPEGVNIVLSVGSGGNVPVSVPINNGNPDPVLDIPAEEGN